MEVGDKVINKGMLDRALGNLQVLFAGAWDQLVAYEAVETLRNLARTAEDAFMEWSLFMQLMDEALADVGKRAKEFATNCSTDLPKVADWSPEFNIVLQRALATCTVTRVDQGLRPALDPEWNSWTGTPSDVSDDFGGKGGRNKRKKQQKQQQQEEHSYQQPDRGGNGNNGRGGDGKGGGKGEWEDWRKSTPCTWVEHFKDAHGNTNHFMCPFFVKHGACRHVHQGLEAHTGTVGVAATEQQFEAIRQNCMRHFPAWTDADTPSIPGRKGKGKGKGKGKKGEELRSRRILERGTAPI